MIRILEAPFPVLQKYYWLIWLAILNLWGGLFYDFYSYLLPLGRNGRLHKPEMQYLGFWGQGRTSQKLLGVQETTFSVVLDNSEYIWILKETLAKLGCGSTVSGNIGGAVAPPCTPSHPLMSVPVWGPHFRVWKNFKGLFDWPSSTFGGGCILLLLLISLTVWP